MAADLGAKSQEGTGDTGHTPIPGARAAVILLLAINLFNYIDRQMLSAVLPKIKANLLRPDDPEANAKLGSLTPAFMIFYMIVAPLFGWLGDRYSRWLLIGIGVILWSLASGASGLAATFVLLWVTRCFVGIGEGAYGPVAPTVISDLYSVKVRGRVLAWFYMAIPVGSALGYVLGGHIADLDPTHGWRWAFYVVVPPGLFLGLLCFFMREPRRGHADVGAATHRYAGWKDYRLLLRTPSYVIDTLGMTAMTFALGGLGAWMPTYIYEREARFTLTEEAFGELRKGDFPVPEAVLAKLEPLRDKEFRPLADFQSEVEKRLSPDEWRRYGERLLEAPREPKLGSVNTLFGGIIVVSGFLATLLGGLAGDLLRKRFPSSYFLVSGVSMLIGFPMIMLVLRSAFPWTGVFIFLACFCLFFNTGPTNTILANVTHPAVRSTAFAVNIFIIHALGDAISPWVIGVIADHSNLDAGFLVVSVLVLVGGIFWLWGARYLERDTALAPTRLDSSM